MSTILESIRSFFVTDEWPHTQLEGKPVYRTAFKGKNGTWTCFAQAREEQHIFCFYSICPTTVPAEKREAIAEFITRANYGMLVGNFELDFNDGEVRYKCSVDVENTELTPALIHNLVYANVWTMDRYLPGIMAVTYGSVYPAEAIKQIEG